jgi:hypothetical protein
MPNGPPPDINPEDLFVKLTQVPRPQKVYEFQRRNPVDGKIVDGKVILQPISEGELMVCRSAAEEYARLQLKERAPQHTSLGYQDLYRDACVVEFVYRACRSFSNPKIPFAPSSQALRQWFFPDELLVLYDAAQLFQTECGPILVQMTEEETEAWVQRLAEGASRVPLALLSSEARIALILSMAARLAKSSTGSGSPGSPPSASSTEPGAGASSPSPDAPPPAPSLGDDERAPEQARDD